MLSDCKKGIFLVFIIKYLMVGGLSPLAYGQIFKSEKLLATAPKRPNIVLILADDLGYSDLGSYGSEIDTPHLDRIAAQGLRFANFHTAASCAPTRAMLLTGVDSHTAGVANIVEAIPDYQSIHPAYQGVLAAQIATVSDHLNSQGYRTYMSGKWHLGQGLAQLPSQRGFDRAFSLADTGADNWRQRPYLPIYEKANWYEDGTPVQLPTDFYSSRVFVDKAIEYISSAQGADKELPFFAYIAFQAVHIPVQAPRRFRDKYLQTYSDGWSVLRQRRIRGLLDASILTKPVPHNVTPTTTKWGDLDEQAKAFESKGMAVYAGMVDAMDHHIGRLVSFLDSQGALDNTVFIFLSDNGAEGSLATRNASGGLDLSNLFMRGWMYANDFNTNIETLGEIDSYHDIGPSWASAAVGPLDWYKFFASEGGMRVPMIIGGKVDGRPIVKNVGEVTQSFSWITDITPTILDLAGVGRAAINLPGHSLMPILTGQRDQLREADDVVGYELGGNKALFKGDYKLVYNRVLGQQAAWRLFDISLDPGETKDLAEAMPKRFAQLKLQYEAWAQQHGVVEVSTDYDQRQEVFMKGVARRPILLVPMVLLLLIGSVGIILLLRLIFSQKNRQA